MTESLQLPETLYQLIIRFNNGEKVSYVTTELLSPHAINPDLRYALITSCSIQNPAECIEVNLVNLRDVAFIKSERISLEDLMSTRRTAGLRSPVSSEDPQPKTISQVKFI